MLPPPSKKGSCRPCRESNADCDKKRPRCGECILQNKPCGGYDLGNIFININSAGPPPTWSRSQNAQKYLVVDWASQAGASRPPSMTMPTPSTVPSNPDSTSIHGMAELFLDLYYRRVNPGKTSSEPLQAGSECGAWRSLIPQWIGISPMLDTTIRALSACFVATQYGDQNLLYQSRNMYLSALQQVQKVLPEQNSAARKDVLATTLVMGSIELFMSNGGGSGQLTHVEGATRLLHCAFTTHTFDELHLYILNQGLFQALSTRSRYLFSDPSYRMQVRQLMCLPRTYDNELYFQWSEIVLPLPNLIHAADSVTATTPRPTILSILDELAALENSVTPWYEAVKASVAGAWTFPAAQISPDSVPFPLQFVSVEACTLFNLYWMSQLLILDIKRTLNSFMSSTHVAANPTDSAQIAEYASLICRSVQFCTHGRSYAATENMFTPLFTVAAYYRRQGDEERMRWCVRAFERIAEEQKIGFAMERVDLAGGQVYPGNNDTLGGVWDEPE